MTRASTTRAGRTVTTARSRSATGRPPVSRPSSTRPARPSRRRAVGDRPSFTRSALFELTAIALGAGERLAKKRAVSHRARALGQVAGPTTTGRHIRPVPRTGTTTTALRPRGSRPPARGRVNARSTPAPAVVHDPRRRLIALLVVLALALTAVVARLWMVQGPGGRRYATLGRNQRLHSAVLPAERGAILDRNGVELAMSTRRRTVWADPRSVRDPAGAARALAPVLGHPEAGIRDKLTTNGGFVYLARKVDDPVADAVAALRVPGVGLLEEPKRVVPAGALAAPVLGAVGLDDEGLSGLERQFEKALAGTPGAIEVEKDPGGNDIASGIHEVQAPSPGDEITLTLDRAMQFETERVLSEQIASSNAKGGIAVVMDPHTGDILAMANLVAGPPGKPPVPSNDNMAVTRVYEPGSVNKLITVAAAIEEDLIRPDDTMVVPDRMKVADSVFHDSHTHATEVMSVERIVAESSNVGTIMIGQRLGKKKIDSYLRDFGLSGTAGLDFPGEASGILPDLDEWSGTSIATLPIGQGVAVTALQMLTAYNTIANGGVYVPPRLVTKVVDADGKERKLDRPETRRVVSEETARAVTPMLEEVVEDGTGEAAAVPGYRVAGKTGTAEKPREAGPGYEAGAYVATFAGFLPASAPRLSVIVALDEPTPYYGGIVAAPVFSRLAGFGLRALGVPPDAPTRGAAGPAGPGGGAAKEAVAGPAGPGGGAAKEAVAGAAGPGGGAAKEAVASTPTTLGRNPLPRP